MSNDQNLMEKLAQFHGENVWSKNYVVDDVSYKERELGRERYDSAVMQAYSKNRELWDAHEAAAERFKTASVDEQLDIIHTHPFRSQEAGELLYRAGNDAVMHELFRHGADPSAVLEFDDGVLHPISLIDTYEQYQLFRSYGEFRNDMYGDSDAWMLRHAVAEDKHELVEGLYLHGVDINSEALMDGKKPLHVVESTRMATFLIEHGAEVNAGDTQGNTPIFNERNSEATMAVLIRAGADIFHRNDKGQNAAEWHGAKFGAKLEGVAAEIEREHLQSSVPKVEKSVKRSMRL